MPIRTFSPSFLERFLSINPEALANTVRWHYFRWLRPTKPLDLTAIGFRWRLHVNDNRTEQLMWLKRKHPEVASAL